MSYYVRNNLVALLNKKVASLSNTNSGRVAAFRPLG
jgi:hypothetical protein